jgi:ribonuclease H / adenosylcobalamin/alpha-ribazole phosphatase
MAMASNTTVPPTRIFVVRHGTTLLNRANRYRGRRDVPLDQGGWEDAWSAARHLDGVGLEAIYSSPLRRARDTGRIVADGAGIAEVTDLPGLTNLDYGAWEGLTAEESRAHDAVAFDRYQEYGEGAFCPGGETLALAERRVELSLRTLAALHPGGTVAAVSHAAIVRLAIVAAGGVERADWRVALPNGSVTVFDVTPDSVVVDLDRVGAA